MVHRRTLRNRGYSYTDRIWPSDEGLTVATLWEDDDVKGLDKPSGLPVLHTLPATINAYRPDGFDDELRTTQGATEYFPHSWKLRFPPPSRRDDIDIIRPRLSNKKFIIEQEFPSP